MDVGLTRCRVEEVVEMRHHRHGWVAPRIISSMTNWIGVSQLTIEALGRYNPL